MSALPVQCDLRYAYLWHAAAAPPAPPSAGPLPRHHSVGGFKSGSGGGSGGGRPGGGSGLRRSVSGLGFGLRRGASSRLLQLARSPADPAHQAQPRPPVSPPLGLCEAVAAQCLSLIDELRKATSNDRSTSFMASAPPELSSLSSSSSSSSTTPASGAVARLHARQRTPAGVSRGGDGSFLGAKAGAPPTGHAMNEALKDAEALAAADFAALFSGEPHVRMQKICFEVSMRSFPLCV